MLTQVQIVCKMTLLPNGSFIRATRDPYGRCVLNEKIPGKRALVEVVMGEME